MVMQRRMEAVVAGVAALANSESKEYPKLWKKFFNAVLPFIAKGAAEDKDTQAEVLKKFVEAGPLQVRPLDTLPHERINTRTSKGAEILRQREEAVRKGLIKRG